MTGVRRLVLVLSLPLVGGGAMQEPRGGGEIRAPAKPGVKPGAMHVKTQSLELQHTEQRFKDWTYHVQVTVISLKP